MQTNPISLISSLWRSCHKVIPFLRFVAAISLLVPYMAGAQEAPAGTEDTSTENVSQAAPVTASEDLETTLDTSQRKVSTLLEEILTRADALFSGNRSYDASTGSYVALGGSYTLRKTEDGANELDLLTRAKINLPYTQKHLKLLIDRDLENVTKSESQRDAQVAAGQVTADDSPYLAVRGIARETLKVALAFDVGARLRLSPDPFVRLRARRLFSFGAWEIPLSETLLYRYEEKFSAATELSFLRSIGEKIAVGIILNATYTDLTGGFDLGVTVGGGYRINDRSLVATELGAYGQTEPDFRDTVYSATLRYRRKILKDWLVIELRPQLVFFPEQEFHAAPSFTVRLEMYFGSNYFGNL
jgi:hypothetical protein